MFVSGRMVVVGLVLLGCATSPRASGYSAADDRAAIMQADRDFSRAAQEWRGEGWAEFFADTTMWPIQLAPAGSSRDTTRARSLRMWRNPDFGLQWNPIYADVAASGDLGYTIGKWTRVVKDSTGAPVTTRGTYLTVWRKQANGAWKVVADTGDEDQ